MGSIIAAILAIICAMGIYIVVIMNGFKILDDNIDKIDSTTESTLIYAQEEGKDRERQRRYGKFIKVKIGKVSTSKMFLSD